MIELTPAYILMETESPTAPTLSLEERVSLELGLKTLASREYLKTCFANARLFDKKQSDYGSRNISGFGTFGIIVRMNDKFERLKTLLGKKRRKPQNESIMDSLRDISNYANIAIMVETNKWPDE